MIYGYLIYGSGNHVRMIADALQLNDDAVLAHFDDQIHAVIFQVIPVTSYPSQIHPSAKAVIGGGGYNEVARGIAKYIGHNFGVVVHPKAIDVVTGNGSLIFAGPLVQAGAIIGVNSIINANVTIGHEAVIGNFCNMYPNLVYRREYL